MLKPKISEADVQRTVKEFLELDGWRAIRTDPVSDRSRAKGFGELGMPDYLFIRYDPSILDSCDAEVLWLEFKRRGQKATTHQQAWHSTEQARGALVLTVGDIDRFTEWYKASGLCRRIV